MMAQKTTVQQVELHRVVKGIMSSLNVRHGAVGQNMPEIEAELAKLQVDYNAYELSGAVNELIKQGVLTIHFATDGTPEHRYNKYFVTLLSKV